MTTIAGWVATAAPADLRVVLDHRPDVRVGAPLRSRQDLADRLLHEPGVIRALAGVPEPGWQVLTALGVLGGWATPADLAAVLGDAPLDDVTRWSEELATRALVVPGGGPVVVANPTAVDVVGTVPGLGPTARTVVEATPAPELQRVTTRWGLDVPKRKAELVEAVVTALHDPVHVRRVLADAPLDVARWLLATARYGVTVAHAVLAGAEPERIDDGLRGPAAYRTGIEAQRWATQHGLAYGSRLGYEAVVPSEVTVALGGPVHLPFTPHPPAVPTAPVAARQVDGAAAAALADLLGAIGAVLDHVRGRPAATLAAGGVGAREITRIAKATGEPAVAVRVALELGAALGLLAVDGRRVVATEAFDVWRHRAPAERAVDVWTAWRDLPTHPTLDRDDDGSALPAMARGVPVVPGTRDAVLGIAAAVTRTPGVGPDRDVRAIVDVAALGDAAAWSGTPGVDEEEARTVWVEAALLGMVALDAVTPAVRALLGGELDAVRAALAGALPAVSATARLGSDLTAVVSGVPSPQVTDLLDLVADREARGAASTWRMSAASVRRAFDAGLGPDDVLARLADVAGTVPQAVDYLVRDVGRRHGHVTVRPAACVLVVPDDALRAELLVASPLRALGLAPVDGAVLTSGSAPDVVLERLRTAGYLPVEQTAGGVRVLGARTLDAAPQAGSPGPGRAAAGSGRPGGTPGGTPGAGRDDADAVGDLARPGVPAPQSVLDADDALRLVVADGASVPDPDVEQVYAVVAQHARRLDDLERRHVAWAVARGGALYVEYRSSTGALTQRVLSGLDLLGGYLTGWCHLRGDERHFRLDGLEMAAPAVV